MRAPQSSTAFPYTTLFRSRQRRVYVLTNYGSTHEQDLYRVNTLRAMGFDPYVMIYERPTAPPVTRHLQRWVNNTRLDRKSTRLNSSHVAISYAAFCLAQKM